MTRRRQRPGTRPAETVEIAEPTAPVRMAVGERSGQRRTRTARVPIGIEKVLYLAATDPAFRARLHEDRAAAVAGAKVRLSDVERTTLLGVPRPALEAMIARISPEKHGKRKLMKTVAAATVSLAAGVLTAGCDSDDDWSGGIRPDVPEDVDAEVETSFDVGGDTAWDTHVDDGWTSEADVDALDVSADGIRPDVDDDGTPDAGG
jgi:hypothetical protein